MKNGYVSPEMEVFSLFSNEAVMDAGCTTFDCGADGVCAPDLGCILDGTDMGCILDGQCITDGQCILDGVSGL